MLRRSMRDGKGRGLKGAYLSSNVDSATNVFQFRRKGKLQCSRGFGYFALIAITFGRLKLSQLAIAV